MADRWTSNTTPATGGVAIYSLVALLLAHGYTQAGSGDGTTFSNSGAGPVTSGGTGVGGLNNTGAWIRLQMPTANGVVREFIFQRGSSSRVWTWQYSYSAGYTGGSPSATVAPTATDSVTLWSAATIFSTDNTYRFNGYMNDAAPYGFWAHAFSTGGGSTARMGFAMDPIASPVAADTDPYAFYPSSLGASAWSAASANDFGTETAAGCPQAFFSTTHTSANFVKAPAVVPFSLGPSASLVSGESVNPFNGNDDAWAVVYSRRSGLAAPNGRKGQSTLFEFTGVARATGDTDDVASTRDRIIVGDVRMKWDGSVVVV